MRASQPTLTSRPASLRFRSRRQHARVTQAVLEMGKPASAKAANGAAAGASSLDASSAKNDMQRELAYRIVSSNPTTDKVYQSLAWSVHNRLVEKFEATDAYWK